MLCARRSRTQYIVPLFPGLTFLQGSRYKYTTRRFFSEDWRKMGALSLPCIQGRPSLPAVAQNGNCVRAGQSLWKIQQSST
jgi:hypothetical protein